VLAYENFLKGREHFYNMTPNDFLKAIEYYNHAVELDSNFSRAYAAIGVTYQTGSNLGWSRKLGGNPGTIRLRARYYLELAMKKPTPEAYNLAATKELHRRNFEKSEALARKASEYSPNSTESLRWLGWIYVFTGRSEESFEYLHKAIRLDPFDRNLNTPISNAFIGVNYFAIGNLEKAVTFLEKALLLNPKLINFSCFLAASHALLGNDIEAKKALTAYLKQYPKGYTPNIQRVYQSWPFKDSKVFDRLAQGLVKAGLPGDPSNYYKLNSQEKLSGQEIKKLLFGKTSSGYPWGIKSLIWILHISSDGEVEYRSRGKTYSGKAWIEGECICLLREQFLGGLKSCDEVYRNPEGDELTKTEYFRVTDYGLWLFSLEK
jgi:tetratricopeptide (TPR) repeat protein